MTATAAFTMLSYLRGTACLSGVLLPKGVLEELLDRGSDHVGDGHASGRREGLELRVGRFWEAEGVAAALSHYLLRTSR